jgi:nitrite reductase (NADH) large subunit
MGGMNGKSSGDSRRILIVGNGAAGISAAKAARVQDPDAEIIIFGKDGRLPYYRLRLCDYIGRSINYEELKINNEEWFEKNRIRIEKSSEVAALDVKAGKISINAGEYSYDRLVLATGSTPIMPPFSGMELTGIHTIWTIDNIIEINKSLLDAKKAAVIGGGLLGLEAAYKISEMGISVSLIESMPRLLPRQLDQEGSEVFGDKVRSLGISVCCGKSVTGFDGDGSGRVRQVHMADDAVIEADAVVVAVGVAPGIAEFRNSGISIDRFINVNEKMETNIEGIYAAGDAACVSGRWLGQWSVALKQGQVAGTNATGGNAVYETTDVPYILATMGTRVVCSGETGAVRPDGAETVYETHQKIDKERFSYSRLVYRDGLFVGYMLVGEPAKAFNKLQPLLNTGTGTGKINALLYNGSL